MHSEEAECQRNDPDQLDKEGNAAIANGLFLKARYLFRQADDLRAKATWRKKATSELDWDAGPYNEWISK